MRFLCQLKIQIGKRTSWENNMFISVGNVHQVSGRNVCSGGWLIQAVVEPLLPLPVVWKGSAIKSWPGHVHRITCQRKGKITVFSNIRKLSYRKKNKLFYPFIKIVKTVLFITFFVPFLCIICQIHSLNSIFPNFS